MSQDPVAQLFRPYIPAWLRERIGTPGLQPGAVTTCNATILYADLSGFTELTAAFATLPDGAERLHDALNRCYTVLIETIGAFGGDVAAIAGDALTAWWPGRTDLDLAGRCGSAMQAAVAALSPLLTPEGPFQLELRIGVSAGMVFAALTGLPSHGVHLVIAGPAVVAAAAAERAGRPGTVQVAPPVPRARRVSVRLPGIEAAQPLSWEQFLPPAFAERLRLNELIAEYRRCVPVFAAFTMPAQPDALHALVAQVQLVVMRWGGWLNEIEVGDKGAVFVLLFGAPVARGDDASRAVGCCLELRERGLIERAGITLGILFVGAVGSSQRRVYTAQGDDMNLAAHLMQQARPGEILVSGRVRHDVMDRYPTTAPTLSPVKGGAKQVPVATLVPRGNRAERAPAALRRYLPDAAAQVGHAQERATIAAVAAAARAGTPGLLIVEGESGIGKSCLLQDLFVRWAEAGLGGLSAECSSGGVPLPLAAWRPIVLDGCGLDEGAPLRQQQAQLAEALAGRLPDPDGHAALLAQTLGLGGARLDATFTRSAAAEAQLLAAVGAIVARQVARGPLLILIEDVHWADELSLTLAGELLRCAPAGRPYPLLLALSHRPLDGPLPQPLAALHAHPATTRVWMGPLASDEIMAMIRTQLGVDAVHDTLRQHVERHTEGQPLFIKEYLRVLRQHNLVQIVEGEARLVRPYVTAQVSNSAQGVIQARVDRLDAATRLTLKVAAVLGRSFSLRLLSTIHPAHPTLATLREQLDTLRALQIVDLELADPERVYRFKFGIAHEVAYTSLLFGQRRQLHAAIADWYEAQYADEIASGRAAMAVFDLLTDHLGRAEERARQAAYCRIAAEQAARQFATAVALRYVEQALVFTGDRDARRALLLLRIAVNDRVGNYLYQAEDLDELAMLLREEGAARPAIYALFYRLRYLVATGLTRAARAWAPTLLRRLRQAEGADPQLRGELQLLRAALRETLAAGRAAESPAGARALLLRAIALCGGAAGDASSGDPLAPEPQSVAARALDGLGRLAIAQGDYEAGYGHLSRALALAGVAGDWCTEMRAREGIGRVLLATGDLAGALDEAQAVHATSSAVGDRAGQAMALRLMAGVHAASGDFAAAARDAQYGIAISAGARARALEAALWEDLAVYAAARGEQEQAQVARQEAERARRQRSPATQPAA